MSDDEPDPDRFDVTMLTRGVTKEMADALLALRRTPFRSEEFAVSDVGSPTQDARHRLSDRGHDAFAARTTSVGINAGRSVRGDDYLFGARMSNTTPTVAVSNVSPGSYRTVAPSIPARFAVTSPVLHGSVLTSDVVSRPVSTTGFPLLSSPTLVDSHTGPISSAVGATSLPLYSSSNRSEVDELKERINYMEHLLMRAQSNVQLQTIDRVYDVALAGNPASTRGPGERPPERPSTVSVESSSVQNVSKPSFPQVKFGIYKGDTSLETFLAKFENCSRYMSWSERDRFFHLSNALDGAAGQVLWDATACSSVEALVKLLRCRFGNQNQTERFRAELKARRRRPGETLQKLYQEICKLMALAYPGQSNEMSDVIAKDAFVDALDDSKLRREILIQQPQDIDAALAVASRLEAYDKSSDERLDMETGYARGRNKQVRTARVTEVLPSNEAAGVEGKLSRRVDMLQNKLDAVLNKFENFGKHDRGDDPPVRSAEATPPIATSYLPAGRSARYPGRDVCRNCFQKGHWEKFCTQPKRCADGTLSLHADQNRANVVTGESKDATNTVYLKIRVNGRPVYCLLDTGCEKSVINSCLVPSTGLETTQQRLFAANGSEVPVKGRAKLRLTVHGVQTELYALVSEAVEDMILGMDWLSVHDVQWDFLKGAIRLNGKYIPLSRRSPQNLVRRLYVAEAVIVPPGHVANVPVLATLRSLNVSPTEWAMEPKQLKKTVLSARTLVNAVKTTSVVPVVNVGEKPCQFECGQFIGNAQPVEVIETGGHTVTVADVPEEPKRSGAATHCRVPEHVVCLLDTLPTDLDAEERSAVETFVCDNADVFSKSEYDIGRTHLVRHRIDTGDHMPFKEPLRRHPMAYWPVIDKHVAEMLANDVVEPAASPWASNVVLIRKKDGTMRFCVDYRRLNDVTRKDSYPLPRIEDCLSALGGACYFSTLDLRSGYWQTAMDERDADKTAFVTRRGVFRFKVLSFGLANAPALFQRLMDYVLAGLTWEACLVYLDDIIVWGDSFSVQLRRLSDVFQRLRDANLKLRSSKCRLFQRKVSFLGHVVSAGGIEPDPEKVSSVVDWPVPRSLTEVRAFLGLASYYRRHIKGFADIARPLHELTRKGEPFRWIPRRQEAFDRLKRCLVTAPVLAAPLDQGRYVLDTDASDIGLGAVLQQEQPEGLRVIAYASRALSKSELSYCTTRKELLALVYGLKTFRQYLLAREILIRTDHAALTYLKRTPEPVAQQARWLDLISEYNFTIQHRSGESNRNADGLSRRACELDCRHCARPIAGEGAHDPPELPKNGFDNCFVDLASPEQETVDEPVVKVCAARTVTPEPVADGDSFTTDALIKSQAADDTIAPVLRWLRAASDRTGRPEWKQLEMSSEDTRTLWAQFDSLELVDGVLYRRFHKVDGSVDHLQLIVPRLLRNQFLKLVHEGAGGHFANRKTQEQVQRRAYWPGWRRSVEQFIRHCLPCAQYQGSKPIRQGALQSFEANGPGDRYCIDLVGPYPRTKRGKKYILTVVDAYTRYLTAIALPEKTATNVSRALIEEVFFKIGCGRSLISDLGTEFQNRILDDICRLLGVQKLRTTVHRPSANGRCERSHRTISTCLAKLVATNQMDWDEKLQLVAFAMNCAKSEATGYSPFELMFGRLPRMPVEMILDLPAESYPRDLDQYVEEFSERLRGAHQMVQQHTRTSFARMKRQYDAKLKDADYAVGQYVLFFYPRRYRGRNPKLARPNIGPFRILQQLNSVNFIIAMTPKSRRMIVHVDKLKPWPGDPPKCWEGVDVMPRIVTRDEAVGAENVAELTDVDAVDPDLPPLDVILGDSSGDAEMQPEELKSPAASGREVSAKRTVRSRIPVRQPAQNVKDVVRGEPSSRDEAVPESRSIVETTKGQNVCERYQPEVTGRMTLRVDGRPTREIRPPARFRE